MIAASWQRAAWCGLMLAWLTACGDSPKPLQGPIPASHHVVGGVRLVVLDGDLAQLVDAVRVHAGKTVDVAAAPWPLPGSPAHVLGAVAAVVPVLPGQAQWTPEHRLQLTWPLGGHTVPLAVGAAGQAACALTFAAGEGQLAFEVEVVRTPQGPVAASLASAPAATWTEQLLDPEGCLAELGPGASAALLAHVAGQIRAALVARYSAAALLVLRTAFPGQIELAGRVLAPERWGEQLETRLALGYAPFSPEQPARVVGHEPGQAVARLDLGLDVDRARCAADAPPPQVPPAPVAPQPALPPGKTFLRRALVVDRAAFAHFAWAIARSGALCQESPPAAQLTLGAGWAAAVLPVLGPWVDGAPTGARFWPGQQVPEVRLVDGAEGPLVEWRLQGVLEVLGRVGDTELVVLRVTGGFRALLRPAFAAGVGVGLEIVATGRDSIVLQSPLAGGDPLAGAEPALGKVIDAGLRGIFASTPVLPLGVLLPEGTVVTSVSRAGDALWLWLDGGPPS